MIQYKSPKESWCTNQLRLSKHEYWNFIMKPWVCINTIGCHVWWRMNQLWKSKFELESFVIELWIDFQKSFMIIELSHPLTDFENSRIMEIQYTNDDPWCDLWIDELWRSFVELWYPTVRGAVTSKTMFIIIWSNISVIRILNLSISLHLQEFWTSMSLN